MPWVRPAPLSAWMLFGYEDGVTPAFGKTLLLPGRVRVEAGGLGGARWSSPEMATGETELRHDWNWPGRVGRSRQRQIDIDCDGRVTRVIHAPHQLSS